MTETAREVRLEDYRPTDFEIETVDLTFRLDPERAIVTSRLGRTRMSVLIATVSISLATLALARTLFF